MNRTLRSKKLRARLYYAQDGKCAICGNALPDNWHADHVVPWTLNHRTNVHEMQALCPKCNQRKGSKMLRKHQAELQELLLQMRRGASKVRKIGVHVTPGGGKSGMAHLLARIMAEPLGMKICWVVPRIALAIQGEADFVDPEKRVLFDHSLKIRRPGNVPNPSGNEIGYITTYDAIQADPKLHQDEFDKRPYILVGDEWHHVPYKGHATNPETAYYQAMMPLVQRARISCFPTGTLARHDKLQVADWPHIQAVGPAITPLMVAHSSYPDWAFIKYSRGDGLEEGAIVPLHLTAHDGSARWFDPNTGKERDVTSMAESTAKDTPAVLHVCLETEYAYQLLDNCTESWSAYRQYVYRKAKMLVIAPTISVAKDYERHQRRMNYRVYRATSDEKEAHDHINMFRENGDILVTVGMCYEGLDVKEISHIALLTNIRSRPWIEQAICRANRTDIPGGKTHGYVFYPDDPLMTAIMKKIEKEQAAVIGTLTPPDWWPKPPPPPRPTPITPLSSEQTRARALGLEDGTTTDYEETARYESIMAELNLRGVSPIQLKQFQAEWQRQNTTATSGGNQQQNPNWVFHKDNQPRKDLPPSVEEKRLRNDLYRKVGTIAKRMSQGDDLLRDEMIKQINTELSLRFGRRETLCAAELRRVLEYVSQKYGQYLS